MNKVDTGFSNHHAMLALLRCFREEIDQVLRPELESEQARTSAALITEMLDHLSAAKLQVAATAGAPSVGDPPRTEVPAAGALAGGHTDWRAEQAALDQFENALQATSRRADTAAPAQAAVEPAALQAYFEAQQGQLAVGDVLSVAQIPGGYSKDTWRIATSRGIQGHQRLVLRCDLPFGPGENTVSDEVEVLNALQAAGLPVPPVLWHSRDTSAVGQPFLLFPELSGQAIMGDWTAPPDVRKRLLLDLARVMARLHSVPALDLLSPGERSLAPAELVRRYVASWQDKWQHRQVLPSSLMDTAYQWLLDNVPEDLDAVSIVHGDISMRNTLIHDQQLVALLDWEFWHPGDPLEDLSYFRLVAEPWIDWNEFMAEYLAAGGPAWDERRANYYAVWRSVRNATTTTTAWHGFLSGDYAVSKAAYQGLSLYRFFLRDIANQLEQRGVA